MDRTLEFSAAVRRFRKAYGASKPASELMRPIQSSQFNTAASTIVSCMHHAREVFTRCHALPAQLASIIRMHGFLLSQMDEFFSNPEEVPEDAVNFIRLAQVQMETLRASIAEKPFSVAVHRKAVIVFLQEVSFTLIFGISLLKVPRFVCSA